MFNKQKHSRNAQAVASSSKDNANTVIHPLKGDAHVLGYLNPSVLYRTLTDSFYETPSHCFSNPDHVFPPSFTGTLFPVRETKKGGPNVDYMSMALAAGLMIEPDKDPLEDEDLRELLGVQNYTPLSEKELSDRWQRETCCRTTIMSIPKLPGILQPELHIFLFEEPPEQDIDHQKVMFFIEKLTGGFLYPAMIQCRKKTPFLQKYAHDFLCVPLVIGENLVEGHQTHVLPGNYEEE